MPNFLLRVFTVAAALCLPLFAATLTTESTFYELDANGNPTGPFICYDTASCSGTYNFAGSSTLTYAVTSAADYGTLRSSASVSVSRPGGPGAGGPDSLYTQAVSTFRDQWIITGGTPGTQGILLLTFGITGSFGQSVSTTHGRGLSLHNITTNVFDSDNQLPPGTGQLSTQFTFGSEFDFRVNLLASASANDLTTGGFNGQFAFMNLSNTAVMTSIVVTDLSGNPIAFDLSTASNAPHFDALAPGNEVPEPTTFVLMGSAIAGVILIRRRLS